MIRAAFSGRIIDRLFPIRPEDRRRRENCSTVKTTPAGMPELDREGNSPRSFVSLTHLHRNDTVQKPIVNQIAIRHLAV